MSICKACGGVIAWKRDASGKWRGLNGDGVTDHWDSCSKRKFERIKASGDYFEIEQDKGYFTNLKNSGVQYIEQHSEIFRGNKFKNVDCDCVPWETCPKKCRARLAA